MWSSQEAEVANGKTYTFWAGGHVVYFECVLLANLVLLRSTNNFTGWGELVIFLQVVSYFVFVYLDSIILTQSAIAYFFDEFMSSVNAWLGCVLVASTIYIEKYFVHICKEIIRIRREAKVHRESKVLAIELQDSAKDKGSVKNPNINFSDSQGINGSIISN